MTRIFIVVPTHVSSFEMVGINHQDVVTFWHLGLFNYISLLIWYSGSHFDSLFAHFLLSSLLSQFHGDENNFYVNPKC